MEVVVQLVAFLRDLWSDIIFWYVVPPTQRAVIFRNGITHREVDPGFHWKMPCIFNIGEEVNYVDVVMETTNTQPQSLVTKDGIEVVVSAIIKHKVHDATKYTTEVMDVSDGIVDVTMGAIKKVVMMKSWDECINDNLDKEITDIAKKESLKWGIRIMEVTVINLARMRSYRLIGSEAYFS